MVLALRVRILICKRQFVNQKPEPVVVVFSLSGVPGIPVFKAGTEGQGSELKTSVFDSET